MVVGLDQNPNALVVVGTQEGVETAQKEKNRYWARPGSYYHTLPWAFWAILEPKSENFPNISKIHIGHIWWYKRVLEGFGRMG